ncbi:hypothetical protein HYU13_01510 [Candidatus Woesearchaeota archaeon]|nr:hypothetical protein [Candidatus Woesearchaeota archaeon]
MLVQLSKGRQLTPVGEDLKKLFEAAKHLNPKHKLTAKQMDAVNEALLR